jgi:hypothetical protein
MRLLSLNNEEIVELIEKMERDSKAIREDVLHICWYMRGSISYDDAMLLTVDDRNSIGKLIKENLETTKKSGMPFF